MRKQSQPRQPKRTYARPLSLAPLSFMQAVDKLLTVKPNKPKKKSRPRKVDNHG